jgi:hypothetical protein
MTSDEISKLPRRALATGDLVVVVGVGGLAAVPLDQLVTALVPSSAYAASNVTPDRTYDAASTTTGELANVLGTLIADLRTKGLIA